MELLINLIYDEKELTTYVSLEKKISDLKKMIHSNFLKEEKDFLMILSNKFYVISETEENETLSEFMSKFNSGEESEIFELTIILLNKNKKDVWKYICNKKINFKNINNEYLLFKINENLSVCGACYIYCFLKNKNLNSTEKEFIKNKFISYETDKICDFENSLHNCTFNFSINECFMDSIENNDIIFKYFDDKSNKLIKDLKNLEELERIRSRDFEFEYFIRLFDIRMNYYKDPTIQTKVLSYIPLEKIEKIKLNLISESKMIFDAKFSTKSQKNIGERDYLVKAMLIWFKEEFFSWYDSPFCKICNIKFENCYSIDSDLEEEKLNGALVTEIWECVKCETIMRFPRYNNPRRLCETKTGRCSEWSNIFGCMLKSLKFDVRLVVNFEDHVFNEYYSESLKRWIHIDSCENSWDTPLLYEQGWGRIMTYILGFSEHGIKDITSRYLKDYNESENRRNKFTEEKLQKLIKEYNDNVINKLSQLEIDDYLIKEKLENEDLFEHKLSDEDEEKIKNFGGRISGSEEWKKERGEYKE